MIGPLLKAQLVAFLTKKLLESKVFVGGVESLHGTVSKLQRGAYDTLLQATREYHEPHVSLCSVAPTDAQPFGSDRSQRNTTNGSNLHTSSARRLARATARDPTSRSRTKTARCERSSTRRSANSGESIARGPIDVAEAHAAPLEPGVYSRFLSRHR